MTHFSHHSMPNSSGSALIVQGDSLEFGSINQTLSLSEILNGSIRMMEYLTSAVIQSPYSFLNENHVKLEMFALDVIDVD